MKALLLIQLGTPKSCDLVGIKNYLTEFLGDPCVIDLPWVIRYPLVNFIITQFRSPKTLALYQKIWTKEGSPLTINTQKLTANVNLSLSETVEEPLPYKKVFYAMRYGATSIREVAEQMQKEGFDEVDILPLYPQYTLSSTVSSFLEFQSYQKLFKTVKWIPFYYDHPELIESLSHTIQNKITQYVQEKVDLLNSTDRRVHILFSYHGIPKRHEQKTLKYFDKMLKLSPQKYQGSHYKTYFDQCHETTDLIMKALRSSHSQLGITSSTSFQSRIGAGWLTPFSDQVIPELAQAKVPVLVISPSFSSDCLETLEEINVQFRELYMENGGVYFDYIPCLNENPKWLLSLLRSLNR